MRVKLQEYATSLPTDCSLAQLVHLIQGSQMRHICLHTENQDDPTRHGPCFAVSANNVVFGYIGTQTGNSVPK